MKVCTVQPPYSPTEQGLQSSFDTLLSYMDQCDDTMDLIVLPEYSDIPGVTDSDKSFRTVVEKNNPVILKKAAETAKRCHALVFVNAMDKTETGLRNTTHAFDRNGVCIGKYYKVHPAPSEVKTVAEGGHGLDVAYSYRYAEPYVLETEGLRIGFLTCYDFYFYEYFPQLARKDLDIVIGCSLQRTDKQTALSVINRFLCYNTNTYLIRASVSLGEDSDRCGGSTVICPDGAVLVDMASKTGLGICEIDPVAKHLKAAGFGGEPKPHHVYMEEGRRPWLYRNGGASVVPFESVMPYPRLCAHRGFSTALPENSMPALGAAVALGAEEIEFDLWSTKDGVLVSCHDDTLERVSNGTGKIYDHTYAELKALDFGEKHGTSFKGLQIATFEEILQKFAGRVIMNIHVKIWDFEQPNDKMEEIVALIRKYDCERHMYFMTASDRMIRKVQAYAPDLPCCVGWDNNKDPMSLVNRALALGVKKIQLFKPYFNEETVKKAHENGIVCNVFWSDNPEEAKYYRSLGIETILTNNFLAVQTALKED